MFNSDDSDCIHFDKHENTIHPSSQGKYGNSLDCVDRDADVIPESPERNLIVYHLLRMVRDLYINSKDGGHSGAYRKQCRTKRKSALTAILSQSEEAFTFRWSCRVLGFNPEVFRNRVIFDVDSITHLMREGTKNAESDERKSVTEAEVWLWEDTPARYQLSDKKGHYVVKMTKSDANEWMLSLQDSPLEFTIERFDLTNDKTILILRHK